MKVIAEFGEDYNHRPVARARLKTEDRYFGLVKERAAKEWKELLDLCFKKFEPKGDFKPLFTFEMQIRRSYRKGEKEVMTVWSDFHRKKNCPTNVSEIGIGVLKELLKHGEEVKR